MRKPSTLKQIVPDYLLLKVTFTVCEIIRAFAMSILQVMDEEKMDSLTLEVFCFL